MKNTKELLAELQGFEVTGRTLSRKDGDTTVTIFEEEDGLYAVCITRDGDDIASSTGIERCRLKQEIDDMLALVG